MKGKPYATNEPSNQQQEDSQWVWEMVLGEGF